MSKRVHIVMKESLIARIDAALSEGESRGEFIRQAVERALGDGPTVSSSLSNERPAPDGEAPAEQLERAPGNPSLVPRGPAPVQESRAEMFRRATQTTKRVP